MSVNLIMSAIHNETHSHIHMGRMQIFDNNDFGALEVVMNKGKPHFIANRCAKTLVYASHEYATASQCKVALKHRYLTKGGYQQEVKLIPEGDLYRLIVRSKLPAAVEFEKWVFEAVLPTIRQTGTFMNNDQIAGYLCSSKGAIQLLEAIVDRDTKIAVLQTNIEESQPLVTMAESIMSTDGLITIGDLAKILRQNGICIGRDRLFMYVCDQFSLMIERARRIAPAGRVFTM